MRFPSSPKRSTNDWYFRLKGWLSGRRLASLKLKRMFFHCNPKKTVAATIKRMQKTLLRRMSDATELQKRVLTHLIIAIEEVFLFSDLHDFVLFRSIFIIYFFDVIISKGLHINFSIAQLVYRKLCFF